MAKAALLIGVSEYPYLSRASQSDLVSVAFSPDGRRREIEVDGLPCGGRNEEESSKQNILARSNRIQTGCSLRRHRFFLSRTGTSSAIG
uniref:Uncharacterized protein n=1 Tax=Candidatus Kentrum sp. UNK TaxID=2126344 RepID=A0A451B2E6_9GAMM|nr:MAG: hypothetical protein BECKUNK1418G_GA0071005_11202 [Candidatus Kentron sp. UNK]VFK72468.1 MAG: hypothetical protein BECKUNK1418H_GA0071006_11172 [Candidatus Kentron sp. UNK]